ncbi:MAG: transposase, partial [Anaerolineales bacterium]|nr:transposase [Anaerolineales bacterium]
QNDLQGSGWLHYCAIHQESPPQHSGSLQELSAGESNNWLSKCSTAISRAPKPWIYGWNLDRQGFPQSPPSQKNNISTIVDKPPTPRAVAHLITKLPAKLTDHESELLNQLSDKNGHLATAIRLGQDFAEMIRQKRPEKLNLWLLKAKQCGIVRLRNFAKGICQDYRAVRAAFSLSYSNGPTEGHINRLKCIKRQMYGRAKIDLLRARLIAG